MLALELGAHQEHERGQVGGSLFQNAEGNRVAGLGEFVDRGRKRGKVRTGRGIAYVDQLIDGRRTPDFANSVENALRLFAIVGMEGAAHRMQPDPVARSFVAEA